MANKKKPNKQRNKTIIYVIAIILILTYGSIVLFGTHGLFTLTEKKSIKRSMIETIKQDSIKNKALKDELEKIKNDPNHIEKVAREKYNMQKPGEKVFQIEKTDTAKKE